MDRVKTREGLRKKHWVNGGKVVHFSRATVTRWSDYSLYVHMKKGRAESKLNVIFIILVPGREINMRIYALYLYSQNNNSNNTRGSAQLGMFDFL